MTDKQIAEKKKEFLGLFCVENEYSNYGYWWKSGEGLEVHLDISSPEKVWDFIEKLVEEVEKEVFANSRLIGEPFRDTKGNDALENEIKC